MSFKTLLVAIGLFVSASPVLADELPPEAIAILQSGICQGCDLSGLDLSGRTLSFTTFTNAKLVGTNFKGADISAQSVSGSNFSDADLSDARITVGNLATNNFTRTRLVRARLTVQGLMDNRFFAADLTDARLHLDVCYHSDFTNTALTRVHASVTNTWRYCNVQGGNADGFIFSGFAYSQTFAPHSLRDARFTLAPLPSNPVVASDATITATDVTGTDVCWISKPAHVVGIASHECN